MISQISSVSFLVYTLLCVESWSIIDSWECGPKTGGVLGDIKGLKYHCLQCKYQFARSGKILYFHF